MTQLPTAVRAALGLVDEAIENVRHFAEHTPELPATLVSNALQLSMRATQRFTELSIRGDELLSRLRGAPEESPAWATFDDDPAPSPFPAPADDEPADAPTKRDTGLIDAEPFAPPAMTDSAVTATLNATSAPAAKSAPTKRTPAKKTPAKKAAAKVPPAEAAPAKKAPAKKAPAKKVTTQSAPAKNASAAKTVPAAKAATKSARTTAAPATGTAKTTAAKTTAAKTRAAKAPVAKKTTHTRGARSSAPVQPRLDLVREIELLELDPAAGAGIGGARPRSALDRVSTDDDGSSATRD